MGGKIKINMAGSRTILAGTVTNLALPHHASLVICPMAGIIMGVLSAKEADKEVV